MTLKEFIRENRAELAQRILKISPTEDITEESIMLWIDNDRWLYGWALNAGVDPDKM